jgi:hypothetical protein
VLLQASTASQFLDLPVIRSDQLPGVQEFYNTHKMMTKEEIDRYNQEACKPRYYLEPAGYTRGKVIAKEKKGLKEELTKKINSRL